MVLSDGIDSIERRNDGDKPISIFSKVLIPSVFSYFFRGRNLIILVNTLFSPSFFYFVTSSSNKLGRRSVSLKFQKITSLRDTSIYVNFGREQHFNGCYFRILLWRFSHLLRLTRFPLTAWLYRKIPIEFVWGERGGHSLLVRRRPLIYKKAKESVVRMSLRLNVRCRKKKSVRNGFAWFVAILKLLHFLKLSFYRTLTDWVLHGLF